MTVRDLRLLQHYFRDPHAIRRAIELPGQVLAALHVVPVQHRRREVAIGAGLQCHEHTIGASLPDRQPSGKPYCFQ